MIIFFITSCLITGIIANIGAKFAGTPNGKWTLVKKIVTWLIWIFINLIVCRNNVSDEIISKTKESVNALMESS